MSSERNHHVFSCNLDNWTENIPTLLEKCELGELAAAHGRVLLKPNLVEVLAPPITTPVAFIDSITDYLLDFLPHSAIIIGEGCGSTSYDTHHAFHELGYTKLAARKNIELIDLNVEELNHYSNPDCRRWPEMHLPKILEEVFLISVPQLKAHSLSKVTLTMKNMMGCAPPSHFRGGGPWNKSTFHTEIHEAIFDLNRYRTPDFTILEASIGMAQAHLWGPECDPPVGKIAASADPVAIDSYGTHLLQRDWRDIGHIVMANGVLGEAEQYTLVEVL